MPQASSQATNHNLLSQQAKINAVNGKAKSFDNDFDSASKNSTSNNADEVVLENGVQLKSVMSELNRLSQSFVHSYQSLESQVEKLNGQLQSEVAEKRNAIEENQQLLVEKASLSDRLQNLLAVMPAGVVVIDGKGLVRDCNAMAVDILGRPLLGESWLTVINRAFDPQADDGHQVSLKDGRKIHIETRALDSEPGQIIVLTDLTKTRQLQAELSQQQKLSSMGKMIASLAHQIRTPLSAAILYGSHLKNEDLGKQVKQQFSDNLMERLHFIERQVNDMLNFMKGERKQKAELSVTDLFMQLQMMSEELPQNVQFSISDNNYGNASIMGDKDSLLGALMNLVVNACDACCDKDDIKITVKFVISHRLEISVEDNGHGISKAIKDKIFEPFVTSKSNGNGLGLAIVHGVIIDHGGQIKVESEESKGTQFFICLPLHKSLSAVSNRETQAEVKHEL
ncbi:PAS domain-containing protein [Aliikangiella marina]|uniref:histidine kinase n=1 Tax=Aliikangiella marina TaxID=1712262 RepID=A0A545TDN0_9GAMM|nr:ATP-binding protein [Aliikangiella marina]TQV75328.1 PAS domain-containing protein [Aliikangiella marina]